MEHFGFSDEPSVSISNLEGIGAFNTQLYVINVAIESAWMHM